MKKQDSKVTFAGAFCDYWLRYFDFTGVSTRAQYWWVFLFIVLINVFCSLLNVQAISWLITVLMFVPTRAVSFRRFHDAGFSGWWNLAPYLLLCAWRMIRSETWMFYLNLEQFPTDLKVFSVLAIIWFLFSLFVFVQPSKKTNNKYRK